MERTVEEALDRLVATEQPFDYATVKALAVPMAPLVPEVTIPEPDLAVYDALLAGGAR